MTPDEHQREKMRLWAWMYENNFIKGNPPEWCSDFADTAVAEFDKRFPAPAAVEVAPISPDERHDYAMLAKEVGILRTKARLWDAVASGKVRLVAAIGVPSVWWADYGTQPGKYTASTRNFHTAAEAVQAAIDAGALK